ncbi:hypothetical protein NKG60_29760 [Mesorhizobium sp. M1428]|uniref:hypothetical protein n=1 Tax=Mesorhizobium sp. M1428 TaxID=2957102 RepID=UPI00333A1417
MSQIVNAAIAYADALTARFAGKINRADHAAVVKTMRDALGNRLPAGQASRLRSILDEKDEAQYAIRAKSYPKPRACSTSWKVRGVGGKRTGSLISNGGGMSLMAT